MTMGTTERVVEFARDQLEHQIKDVLDDPSHDLPRVIEIRVRPSFEGRTDEEKSVCGRADHRGSARARR
jgi:hypothetical protein